MKKKKTLKSKLKKFEKKIKNKIKDAYYINRYYKAEIRDNTVLLESKNGEDVAGNIFYIIKELNNAEYSELDIYLVARKNKIEKFNALLETYKINNVKIVRRMSFRYLKLLATSKYLFNDTSFPYLFIKREGQIYTNTWHGTPLKCMSNDVPDRRYAMGNVKRNFMMADYLIYPNNEMEQKMLSAYSMEELYQGKILNAGYPRNAIFFNKEREKSLKEELNFGNKEVIVYMPTWRGIMTNKAKYEQYRQVINSLRVIDKLLKDNQVFLVKMHILVQKELDFSAFNHIKAFPEGYETYDVLNVADCLVTDYSSVLFDFANSRKKIILYTYDREEYVSTRGLYYDLEDLPFPKVETPEELVEAVNQNKNYEDENFIKKFCTYDNVNATRALVRFVIKGQESDSIVEKETKKNGKNNILIYSGPLILNGITSALVSLLNNINLDKENIFITFREKTLKKNPLRLEKLPSQVDVFPIINGFRYSLTEICAYVFYYKFNIETKWITKKIDELYKRELIRFYGYSKIDRAIQFFGYEKRIIGLFQRFDVPKAIFVHSDMYQEMKNKGNQHGATLRNAYNRYDRVISVTKDIEESILKIGNNKDNIVLVNNAHDYNHIINKSNEEIEFDEQTKSNVSVSVLEKILKRKDIIKFINIGRFSEEKGHKRLINAFNEFYKKHKNAYLFIIGGYGKTWGEVNSYIQQLDCKYNVILIRYMRNPFPILKQCDLFILSSFYEALGLVILEAQTCGIPVISVDIKGPRGFMKEHGGYLVENSEEGILSGMKDFMDGKVKLMNFNAEEYNQNIKKQYESIFEERREETNVKSRNSNICKCP